MINIKRTSKHKKIYIRLFFGLLLCAIISASIYGGIKWYRYHKTHKFYYELCMGLKNGYNQQIYKAKSKNSSAYVAYIEEKKALVTEDNCKCVARWQSRTLYRKYILDLMDRIEDNIDKIRDYDTLAEGMFTGKISKLESEVYSLVLGTEIDLKDCATIGFDGKLKALEDLLQKRKSTLDSVGVGHMYKPKTYNVLN